MNGNMIKFSLLVAIGAILIVSLTSACGGGGEPQALTIPVTVDGKSMEPETVRVTQGDMVTLQIQTEHSGEFHVHGYDVKTDAEAGETTDLFFQADPTGRFKITFHKSETTEKEVEEQANDSHHEEEIGDKGTEHDEASDESEIELGYLEVAPR